MLEDAIAFAPRHPSTYRARYLAGAGYEELGKIAQARQQLSDNLYNFSLTPESNDWRDSIFLLGRLVYHELAVSRKTTSICSKSAGSGASRMKPIPRRWTAACAPIKASSASSKDRSIASSAGRSTSGGIGGGFGRLGFCAAAE